ncbi:hypothetical protein ATY75_28575 [Rhizobium sp. N122]|nr:hypothetical protein ATY75_28575 [Rhizobium sp. N122]
MIEPKGLSYESPVRYILPRCSLGRWLVGVRLPAIFVCFIVEIFTMKNALPAMRLRFDIFFPGRTMGGGAQTEEVFAC